MAAPVAHHFSPSRIPTNLNPVRLTLVIDFSEMMVDTVSDASVTCTEQS